MISSDIPDHLMVGMRKIYRTNAYFFNLNREIYLLNCNLTCFYRFFRVVQKLFCKVRVKFTKLNKIYDDKFLAVTDIFQQFFFVPVLNKFLESCYLFCAFHSTIYIGVLLSPPKKPYLTFLRFSISLSSALFTSASLFVPVQTTFPLLKSRNVALTSGSMSL